MFLLSLGLVSDFKFFYTICRFVGLRDFLFIILASKVFPQPYSEKQFCFSFSHRSSYIWQFRCSHRRCSIKKGVRKKFCKIHRKTPLPESLFLIKLQAATTILLKMRLQHSSFLVNFAKFLRTPFLQNTSFASDSFCTFFQTCISASIKGQLLHLLRGIVTLVTPNSLTTI